jgi:hypothetical protein
MFPIDFICIFVANIDVRYSVLRWSVAHGRCAVLGGELASGHRPHSEDAAPLGQPTISIRVIDISLKFYLPFRNIIRVLFALLKCP